MSILLRNLTVQSDNNFIRLCNDSTIDDVVICNIEPPANAINGYQLNVILGPNLTSISGVNVFITARRAISFNWRGTLEYKSDITVQPALSRGNIIYPEYAMSSSSGLFKDYGMANVSWDPNLHLSDLYPPDISPGNLLRCQKLLQFVYVTNYFPIRRSLGSYVCNDSGNFWILQNIQVLGIDRESAHL